MPEDDVVKIMSSLGIDLAPATTSIRQFSAEIERLNSMIGKMQLTVADLAKRINADISSQLAGIATQNKIVYDQYGKTLKTVDNNTAQVTKATKTASQVAKEHARTVQDVAKQYNVLGSQFERRLSWYFAGGVAFGSIGAFKEAVQTISEVESGMVEIARVTEDIGFNFAGMRKELFEIGKEYGARWQTVQQVAEAFAQAGYGMKDTIELTKDALLGINTAELSINTATSGSIALMAQWNLSANELLSVIDKINKVA